MTMSVNIVVNDNGAIKAFAEFPKARDIILTRALNKTADWSRTRTLDAITDHLNVKRSDLDGRHRFGGVTVKRATPAKLLATVNVTGDRIPLYRFKGKPTKPPLTRQKGISYQITADGGRKRLTTNAFVGVMTAGHTGFFKRESGATKRVKIIAKSGRREGKAIWSENPLIELYGPSVPQVAQNNPEFKKLVEVDASERLAITIEREGNFFMTGNSKGGSE